MSHSLSHMWIIPSNFHIFKFKLEYVGRKTMFWEGSRGLTWVGAVEHMRSEHRRGNVESGKTKQTWTGKEDRREWSQEEYDQCSYQSQSSSQLPLLPYENSTTELSTSQQADLHRNLLAFWSQPSFLSLHNTFITQNMPLSDVLILQSELTNKRSKS